MPLPCSRYKARRLSCTSTSCARTTRVLRALAWRRYPSARLRNLLDYGLSSKPPGAPSPLPRSASPRWLRQQREARMSTGPPQIHNTQARHLEGLPSQALRALCDLAPLDPKQDTGKTRCGLVAFHRECPHRPCLESGRLSQSKQTCRATTAQAKPAFNAIGACASTLPNLWRRRVGSMDQTRCNARRDLDAPAAAAAVLVETKQHSSSSGSARSSMVQRLQRTSSPARRALAIHVAHARH